MYGWPQAFEAELRTGQVLPTGACDPRSRTPSAQVDETHVSWDVPTPEVGVGQEHVVRGQSLAPEFALLFGEDPFLLAEITEPVGFDFEANVRLYVSRVRCLGSYDIRPSPPS